MAKKTKQPKSTKKEPRSRDTQLLLRAGTMLHSGLACLAVAIEYLEGTDELKDCGVYCDEIAAVKDLGFKVCDKVDCEINRRRR